MVNFKEGVANLSVGKEEDHNKMSSSHDAAAEPELEYDEEINSIVTEGNNTILKFNL